MLLNEVIERYHIFRYFLLTTYVSTNDEITYIAEIEFEGQTLENPFFLLFMYLKVQNLTMIIQQYTNENMD